MKRIFQQLDKWTSRGARISAIIGLTGVLTLSFLIVFDVLARWLFNAPITGVHDVSSLFVAIAIAACMPVCILEGQHITIRILGKLAGTRYGAAFNTFGFFVTMALFFCMSWQLWLYSDSLASEKEVTMVLGWPLSPWWRIISIITAFCVLIQLSVLIQSIKELLKCISER
jgi:TRAP-type C4-dicarboxylate transport system permease small subunit